MTDLVNYTEIFASAQGEGKYIGVPSIWLRFYLCNLQCRGFNQPDPTDPNTYHPVGNDLDLVNIKSLDELPVFTYGCDSAYSVAKKYRHLIYQDTVPDVVDKLTNLIPGGKFHHQKTSNDIHMVFTGGEPMLKNNQLSMVRVIDEFSKRHNYPSYVTVETNGTKPVLDELKPVLDSYKQGFHEEWFWSVSPKLFSTSGEPNKSAIRPEVVAQYASMGEGQLKFVVNGTNQSWDELETVLESFRKAGCHFPVWVMGVGGTSEALVVREADIADQALARGYNYSSRVHVHIYGNVLGK